MSLMPPNDSMFLMFESREHPMHVGSLQLFTPPDDAGPDFARTVYEQMSHSDQVSSLFRTRPGRPLNAAGFVWWAQDDDVDFEYHVRHSALPGPGRVRELLAITSRWHGALLDRHRPLWEMHVVEGLADGRFAIYTKMHHSLVDGVSALKLLQRMLSDDPNVRDSPAPWSVRTRRRTSTDRPTAGALLRSGGRLISDVAGMVPATVRVVDEAMHDMTMPLQAPRTMFNVPIGGARRFAAQSWEIDRIRAVATGSGTTLNNVVLAMCSGALRTYLLENDGLPDAPLTAMVPVSLALREADGDATATGNAVGAIVVSLATDEADPVRRLAGITASVDKAKGVLRQMTPLQVLAFSAAMVGPLGLGFVPGVARRSRPAFNVIISNVPGPTKPMYWNGARLDGVYPASIVLDGQAVNITLTSNNDTLDFGIVGCRHSVPHLQRLLTHLETSLAELEHEVVSAA